jgi:hypothetical protein
MRRKPPANGYSLCLKSPRLLSTLRNGRCGETGFKAPRPAPTHFYPRRVKVGQGTRKRQRCTRVKGAEERRHPRAEHISYGAYYTEATEGIASLALEVSAR